MRNPITLLSLMLPPAILGPYGSANFVSPSLVAATDGAAKFSPELLEFLKDLKKLWSGHDYKANEDLETGCPLAKSRAVDNFVMSLHGLVKLIDSLDL